MPVSPVPNMMVCHQQTSCWPSQILDFSAERTISEIVPGAAKILAPGLLFSPPDLDTDLTAVFVFVPVAVQNIKCETRMRDKCRGATCNRSVAWFSLSDMVTMFGQYYFLPGVSLFDLFVSPQV